MLNTKMREILFRKERFKAITYLIEILDAEKRKMANVVR